MQNNTATAPKTSKATHHEFVDANFIRHQLGIGRTKFYDDLKTGRLPPPRIRLGPRSPRWLWADVVEYLLRQNNREAVGYE